MKNIIKFVIAISATGLVCLFDAYVFSYLWLWFVVPFGIFPITVMHAWGLCVLLGVITHNYTDKSEIETLDLIIYGFVYSLTALILGFVIHLSM